MVDYGGADRHRIYFLRSGIDPSGIAAQKAQGIYDAYLRTETLRVVKPLSGHWRDCVYLGVPDSADVSSPASKASTKIAGDHGHFRDLFRYPHFLLAVVAQFLYVGAQVGTWSYFIQYVQEYAHQPEKVAGYFLTGTLAAFGVGRFVSAYLMRFIPPNKLMGGYSVVNFALVACSAEARVDWPVVSFSDQFFHVSDVSDHICARSEGLGPNTKIGGSLLVMAIVGGAVLTPIMGLISVRSGSLALAYTIPLVTYIYMMFYSLLGSKPRAVVA